MDERWFLEGFMLTTACRKLVWAGESVVRMIEDDNQQFWEGTRLSLRVLQAEFSERPGLRITVTKPAEFSSPNRSTQLYDMSAA
jgi:hypothetical protein